MALQNNIKQRALAHSTWPESDPWIKIELAIKLLNLYSVMLFLIIVLDQELDTKLRSAPTTQSTGS